MLPQEGLGHLARHDHVAGTGLAQRGDQPLELAQVEPFAGVDLVLERAVGEGLQGHRRDPPAAPADAPRHLQGEAALAGDQTDGSLHGGPQRLKPRSELSMKRTRRPTSAHASPSSRTFSSAGSRRSFELNRI